MKLLLNIGATQNFYSVVLGWHFTQWGMDSLSFYGANIEGDFIVKQG